ncbi:MAG: hypothetical protein J5518_00275 [Lachnospiraceae bacterium]|nr:hypothetical protein [Lachnospiraceae bacterium]
MRKLHFGTKRMLTGLLAAAMIVTALPGYAFAEEIQADPAGGSVVYSETAEDELIGEAPGEEPAKVPEAEPADEILQEEVAGEEIIPETEAVVGTDELEETEEAEEAEEVEEMLGAPTYTVAISEDMENDLYTILPAYEDAHIVEQDSVYYVEENATEIRVELELAPCYSLTAFTAKIGEAEARVVNVDYGLYQITVDEQGTPINGNVTFGITLEPTVYTLTFITNGGIESLGIDAEAENVTDNGDGTVTVAEREEPTRVRFAPSRQEGYEILDVDSRNLSNGVSTIEKNEDGSFDIHVDGDQIIGIRTEERYPSDPKRVTFHASAGADIYPYRPVLKTRDGILALKEDFAYDAVTETEVQNGDLFEFHVDYDEENYTVEVKQGRTVLDAQRDTYRKNPSATEEWSSSAYYVTPPVTSDTEITVTLKAKTVSDQAGFILDNASHAKFSTKNAKLTDTNIGKYTFNKGTSDFTFTLTEPVAYTVEAGLWRNDGDEWVKEAVLNLTETTDRTYANRILTYKGAGTRFEGKKLVIEEKDADPVRLTVNYGEGICKPTVSIAGSFVAPESEGTTSAVYSVPQYQTVTVKAAAAADNYKLSAVTYNDTLQPAALKSGSFKFVATADSVVSYTAAGIPRWQVNGVFYNNKATAHINSFPTNYYASVIAGSRELPIQTVSAVMKGKKLDGFATINGNGIRLDQTGAATMGTDPVKVTVTGEFGTMELNFIVAQNIDPAALGIKGFQDGKVKQINGTTVSYPVTLNKGADLNRLQTDFTGQYADYVKLETDAKGNPVVEISAFHEVLSNRGGSYSVLAPKTFTFQFKDKYGGPIGNAFTVETEAAKLPAPTATFVSSTDIDMTLSLGVPKTVQGYKNLYYCVMANAADVPEGSPMKDNAVKYVRADQAGTTCTVKLTKNESADLGDGTAQKYDVGVCLLQVINDDPELSDAQKFVPANLVQEQTDVKCKVLKNVSTKNQSYETKLSLNKKNVSFTAGEKNVVLATAKFSAKTSYARLGKASFYSSLTNQYNTEANSDVICLTEDKLGVMIKDSTNLKPGTYSLSVLPCLPGDAYCSQPASLTVTVKAPVNEIAIHLPSTKLFKAENKAASMKITADCYYVNAQNKWDKPAENKVEWTITSVNNDALSNALSINKTTGVLTLDKNYVLSPVPRNNMFIVRAKATDLGADGKQESTAWITITDKVLTPASVKIGNVAGTIGNGKPAGVVSAELYGKSLMVLDANGEEISKDDLSIDITPKKGMTLEGDGKIYVKSLGTYTVKVTCNDGGKKSLSAKFAVTSAQKNATDPYQIKITAYYGNYEANKKELYPNVENNTNVNADNAAFLKVTVDPHDPYTAKSITENKAGVTVKNAKKISSDNDGGTETTILQLTGEQDVEITVADRSLKLADGKTYEKTFKVSHTGSEGTLMAKKSYTICKTYLPFTFTFDLKDVPYSANSGKCKLVVTPKLQSRTVPMEELMASFGFSEILMNGMTSLQQAKNGDVAGQVTLSFASNILASLMTGTYECDLSLWTIDEQGNPVKRLTDVVPATFKVEPGPAVKMALNPNLSIAANETKTDLKYKTCKNVYYMQADLSNDVPDGMPNNFKDYFSLSTEKIDPAGDSGNMINYKWVLERTDKELPAVGTKLSGWIEYMAIGTDGNYDNALVNREKITVTVTKAVKKPVQIKEETSCTIPMHADPEIIYVSGRSKDGKTQGKPVVFRIKPGEGCDAEMLLAYYVVGEVAPEYPWDEWIELDPADDGTYTIPQDVVDQAEADLEDIYIYAYPVHMVY